MKGTAVSPGIAIGKVFLLKKIEVESLQKNSDDTQKELAILETALEKSALELEKLIQASGEKLGETDAGIFQAHLMILQDDEFVQTVRDRIQTEKLCAAYAVVKTAEDFYIKFMQIEDEYIRERAADVKDVGMRVIKSILGTGTGLEAIPDGSVIVAQELSPSDTASMDSQKVCGIITESGGRTSHAAIIARNLGIPAIVGAGGITERVETGTFIVFNGESGEIFIQPDEELVKKYIEMKAAKEKHKKLLMQFKDKKTFTHDNHQVELYANIASQNDTSAALENGAQGVGLFRTEFLYMNRDNEPSEEEQFVIYKKVLSDMKSKPVIIRTLDIGGDKNVPYLGLEKEDNPFLGFRAIRICLEKKEMFKKQLRAILRASIFGRARIMFPMISCLEELMTAKEIISECMQELDKRSIEYDRSIQIGIMIEVPSAAVISDILAKECDFFSIGTNDLIQYTTAVDRMNPKIADLYNQYNPAVLRLIKTVIENGHKEKIDVGMCGEAAGDEIMAYLLLGLGLDEFSMSPSCILNIRRLFSLVDMNEAVNDAQTVLTMKDAREIKKFLEERNKKISER
ncbi:MAG TPA: phosphoenolpyruvate--protein phosphotransferase [Petrotogaceae bacterium]|jgi:phosphotransferase system enzyme I (PtsI)|nr:phosphoenolpyruvate--protein phosphotransferase [Petrotogaceae bacterium]